MASKRVIRGVSGNNYWNNSRGLFDTLSNATDISQLQDKDILIAFASASISQPIEIITILENFSTGEVNYKPPREYFNNI
jgi:hypothetical protein